MSRGALNTLLVAIILGGSAFLVWGPQPGTHGPLPGTADFAPRDVGPALRPTVVTNAFGAPEARVDLGALRDWCARSHLPAPPSLGIYEPPVAAALLDAYEAVVTRPGLDSWERLGQVLAAVDAGPSADAAFAMAERDAGAYPETSARLAHFRGVLAQQAGEAEAAAKFFNQAVLEDSNYGMSWGRLAHVTLELAEAEGDAEPRTRRLSDAESFLQQYQALLPHDGFGWVLRSRLELLRGDAGAARESALQALRLEPPSFQSLHALGQALVALGRDDEALAAYQRADALPQGAWFNGRDPWVQQWQQAAGSTRALTQRFEALQAGDDYAGLIALGEQIVARRPDDSTMLGNLAELYRKTKDFARADAALDRALALAPDAGHLHAKRATLRLSQGRYAESVAAADEALARHAGDARAWSVKGRAQLLSDRPGEAELALRRAVQLDPDDVSTLLVLVTALETLGRAPEACTLLDQLLGRLPDLPAALQAQQRLGCP